MKTILKKKDLIDCFELAKEKDVNYIAVLLDTGDLKETVINEFKDIDRKLMYYEEFYDEDLNHKFVLGVKIVDFTYGYYFTDIERELLWELVE